MSRESTIKRVESDVASGDLGKARDRLHGLIATYPDDVSLRPRLASIYWKLQYLHMAGCYWFLEENQTNESRQAVALFEKHCGGDPRIIWHHLKFRGDPETLPPYARARLDHVIDECKRKHGYYPRLRDGKTEFHSTRKQKVGIAVGGTFAILVICIIVLGFIKGIINIIEWFW